MSRPVMRSKLFQSTLPMRGATLIVLSARTFCRISIHTPHAGSDSEYERKQAEINQFQSTLPMRGATNNCMGKAPVDSDFNPHSPCGERRWFVGVFRHGTYISIHTPHAGSDSTYRHRQEKSFIFQSTLPMRGATLLISRSSATTRFQSTLPMRGATGRAVRRVEVLYQFQSTLPMRGATCRGKPIVNGGSDFNPHSPCGERRERCEPVSPL